MSETIIYFVRHGTFRNPKKIIAGKLPLTLSKLGKLQIRKAGKFFSKRPIAAIYSSPIKRTLESAKLLSNYLPNSKILIKNSLQECGFSKWQGRPLKQIKKTEDWKIFNEQPLKLNIGEKIEHIASRMNGVCDEILSKFKGKEVICVSHQDPIRALRLKLENKSLNFLHHIPCSKGSITSFYFKGRNLNKVKYFKP